MKRPILAFCLVAACFAPAQEPVPGQPPAAAPPGTTERAARDRARRNILPNGDIEIGVLHLHRADRSISFPAEFIDPVDVLEAIVVTPGGRDHEALLKADISPLQLQAMLYLLGLQNGARLPGQSVRQGDIVDLDIEWSEGDAPPRREPIESWIRDSRTQGPMRRMGWVFVGSGMKEGKFQADEEGNVCINYSVGATILDIPDPAGGDDTMFTLNKDKERPPKDAKVRVVITPRPKDKGPK